MPKINLTEYKVGELRQDVNGLKEDIKSIKENHLAHIKEDISDLKGEILGIKSRVNVMTAINIGGIILGLIAAKLLK